MGLCAALSPIGHSHLPGRGRTARVLGFALPRSGKRLRVPSVESRLQFPRAPGQVSWLASPLAKCRRTGSIAQMIRLPFHMFVQRPRRAFQYYMCETRHGLLSLVEDGVKERERPDLFHFQLDRLQGILHLWLPASTHLHLTVGICPSAQPHLPFTVRA